MIFRIQKRKLALPEFPQSWLPWVDVCSVKIGELSEGLLRGMLKDRCRAEIEYQAVKVNLVDGLDDLGKFLNKESHEPKL